MFSICEARLEGLAIATLMHVKRSVRHLVKAAVHVAPSARHCRAEVGVELDGALQEPFTGAVVLTPAAGPNR
jgi:hypothetical protein